MVLPDYSLNNNPRDHVLPSYGTSQFTLQTVTLSVVKEVLQTIDCRKATGEDNLDSYFLKLAAPIITNQITHLFNLSISTGVIPQVWKSAHVVPLHKGGDKNDRNNYRAISKLSCLAKILESLVNNQLKSFLSSNSVLNPHQSGFRAKHSTVTATTLVINDIITAVNKGQYCAALFVDLSKAFDTVDHALLLQRLHDIGFDCNTCKWFQDYLSHRQQCVILGNDRSTFLPLSKGVPQGSILGPVLFTIYINNITSSITNCNAHLYADDTVLYCFSNTAHSATQILQQAFDNLQNALCNLKLVLNANKTKYMLFSRARDIVDIADNGLHVATINGHSIERVSQYKYLGIWLDQKVNF